MTRSRHGQFSWIVFATAFAFLLAGGAGIARAQGELERTPWATSMIYPVGDPIDYQLPAPGEIRGFSLARGLNLGRRGDRHEGLDLGNRGPGAQVRAVAPGLVVCTRTGFGGGWGNMVVLAHRLPGGDVLFSLFAHLMPGSIAVREGQVVALGQPLGKVGQTGHASGPHLHLEFRSIKGSLERLGVPFGQAWERASVVDPLRIFTAMLPPEGGFSLPSAFQDLGGPGASSDPMRAMVDRGGLAPSTLSRPDDALSRGELYRMALCALEAPGVKIPGRWSAIRDRLQKRVRTIPEAGRATFATARMPKREADARGAAGLTETADVFAALEVTRAAAKGTARGALSPTRAEMEAQFPHGLESLAITPRTLAATPTAIRLVGPPAVTRRQASLLWAWVESGSMAGPATSAVRGLSSTEMR